MCVCVRLKKKVNGNRQGTKRSYEGVKENQEEENQWFKCRVPESVELKVRTGLFLLLACSRIRQRKGGE